MVELFGKIVLWAIAVAALAVFPLSEFARGMATNPSAHKASRGGCLISLIGIALIVALILD